MGQYHTVFNTTKKECINAHGIDNGMKLLEQVGFDKSTSTALWLLLANSNGRGGGDAYDHPMIGRWAGAVSAFDLQKSTKALLIVVVPIVAFCLILAANLLAQKDVSALYWYILCVAVQIGAFFYVGENPIKSLMVFGSLGVAAMLIGMFSTGQVAVYAFLSGGLFCSILWPCIFSLSIAGLGKFTSQGSAFLIMMILGGGIIPPIQGKLADLIGIQSSYVIAVLCFGYLVLFAVLVRKILKNQGIDLEGQVMSGGH